MNEWREIPGYPNYLVNRVGQVYSRARPGAKGRIKAQVPSKHGHLRVSVCIDGKQKDAWVHILVALAFLGPRPDGMEVRHLNGNPRDNRPENLAWGTKSENNLDAVRHGTHFNASKTHCSKGHKFTPENTSIRGGRGGRRCKDCDRAYDRQRRIRARVAAAV